MSHYLGDFGLLLSSLNPFSHQENKDNVISLTELWETWNEITFVAFLLPVSLLPLPPSLSESTLIYA